MRTLWVLFLTTFILLAPAYGIAGHHEKKSTGDQLISAAKENPGKTTGVAACGIAIAFFPPAALMCGGAIIAGAGLDNMSK